MTGIPIPIGPFAAIFVGDGPPSSDPLIKLTAKRTRGGFLTYTVPQTWSTVLNNFVQSGPATLEVRLGFYDHKTQIINLSMGNPIGTSSPATASSFSKYTLILAHLDPDVPKTILIPECATEKKLEINREKKTLETDTLLFHQEHPNRFVLPWDIGTLDEMVSASGRTIA